MEELVLSYRKKKNDEKMEKKSNHYKFDPVYSLVNINREASSNELLDRWAPLIRI